MSLLDSITFKKMTFPVASGSTLFTVMASGKFADDARHHAAGVGYKKAKTEKTSIPIALPKVIPGSSCRSHEELSFFSHALFINHGGKGNGPGHRVSIWRSMGAKRPVIRG